MLKGISTFFSYFIGSFTDKTVEKQRSRGQTSSRGKRSGRKGGQGKGKRGSAAQQKVETEDDNSQDMSDSTVK